MPTLMRFASFALFLVLFAGCSGGGGGGGTPALATTPTILTATLLGGGSPTAGAKLQLLMSESVQLVGGRMLDDEDFTISGSGTLGTVTAAPVLVNSWVVEITLGAGVSFSTGTTTIAFSDENDAVTDGGTLAGPGTARTIKGGDAQAPFITGVTIDGIDTVLNGGGPAGGTLQVAHQGFAIDMSYLDLAGIDTASTLVTANRDVNVDGANLRAGDNLVPHLTASAGPGGASFVVPDKVSFYSGDYELTCIVADTTGRTSALSKFKFRVKTRNDQNRPFESGQVWFLDTSRDVERFSVNLSNSTTPIVVTSTANGRSDLEDLLHILGLQTSTPISDVQSGKNSNEVVMDMLRAQVLSELDKLYGSVSITFTFTKPGNFPANSEVIPYASFGFSQICIGGAFDSTGTSGVLGLALFDPHNEVHENDCLVDFQGDRLGVFLHTLVNNEYVAGNGFSQFSQTYNPFAPVGTTASTGTPIGNDSSDGGRLTGATSGGRTDAIFRAIGEMGRFLAVVVAHEIGHSSGLVKNGAMPTGLFGDSSAFPGSSPGHIRMPSTIYTGNSFNVMTPALSYTGTLNPGTTFNTLNMSYLRESAIYD